MFIELAEILDCPVCAEGCGLVAFVRESERRRVLTGHLGCPLCEIEIPIVRGAIAPSRGSGAADGPTGDPGDRGETAGADPAAGPEARRELVVRVAALLGLADDDGGRAILLGPGLALLAPEIARSGARIEAIALAGPEEREAVDAWTLEELEAGVNPIVGMGAGAWPIRAGSLAGVAWRGPLGAAEPAARRALRPNGRLVLIDPDPTETERLADTWLDRLASDESAWVGARRSSR